MKEIWFKWHGCPASFSGYSTNSAFYWNSNSERSEAQEGILICALPTSVVSVILASRYRFYESEASSTLLLTSMMMIATLPVAIALISH